MTRYLPLRSGHEPGRKGEELSLKYPHHPSHPLIIATMLGAIDELQSNFGCGARELPTQLNLLSCFLAELSMGQVVEPSGDRQLESWFYCLRWAEERVLPESLCCKLPPVGLK